ncbi:MAG TPA: Arc family DNA-binding protein [Propionibacteriaceae bacterium]|nr:Arc family DNA-binding protein [Propionibacteriaceae bacterium]
MDLSPYVQTVRDGVSSAAALADDHTREVAERLGGSIESSTRLALIAALSDATSNISAELAPSSVEVRMVGQDPELVVSVPKGEAEPTVLQPPTDAEPSEEDVLVDVDDEPVARISLRLPQSVKAKVDEVAAADGISTNAWLTRAVMDALAASGRPEWPRLPVPPRPPVPPHPGAIFGPNGPFGPHGVFGPHGPFGAGGLFGGEKPDKGPGERPRRPGRVQGWVR